MKSKHLYSVVAVLLLIAAYLWFSRETYQVEMDGQVSSFTWKGNPEELADQILSILKPQWDRMKTGDSSWIHLKFQWSLKGAGIGSWTQSYRLFKGRWLPDLEGKWILTQGMEKQGGPQICGSDVSFETIQRALRGDLIDQAKTSPAFHR